jgi:MtN3 and saliva related transmembrane protein
MITSVPAILFNTVNVVFAGLILAMKLRSLKPLGDAEPWMCRLPS